MEVLFLHEIAIIKMDLDMGFMDKFLLMKEIKKDI